MQLKHRVSLGGAQLDEIDERIIISSIETAEPKENISTVTLMGPGGSRVTGIHRDSLDVVVKFRLRVRKTEMAERESLLESINAWARNGGWLRTSYKENRQIRVFLAQAASAGDPWEWTKEYKLVFRACGVPYWQQRAASSASIAGRSSGSVTLETEGSAMGVIDAEFTNTSGSAIGTVIISTADDSIRFDDLALANGETLVVDHNNNGKRCVLRARIRNAGGSYRSVLGKRTPGSSNDLTIAPGVASVSYNASRIGTFTASGYGRFA